MRTPDICLRIASPDGDLAPTEAMLDVPLEGCPAKTPYRIYFQAIQEVLARDDAPFASLRQTPDRIVLRAEKHGAFAHPASVEAFDALGGRVKRVALVATTPPAIAALKDEYERLRSLRERFELPYLPRPLLFDTAQGLGCLLAEWFEDFHEFHVTDAGDFVLWDYQRGLRPLTREQVREVFRQIGFILTSYYDPQSHAQIHPWRHAAGDFIVKAGVAPDHSIDVRLTTARGYGPRASAELGAENPRLALLLFFLDITLCGRLDRVQGVGEAAWLPEPCLEGLVRGFFQGLAGKDLADCGLDDFSEVLVSFAPEELRACLAPVLDTLYGQDLATAEVHADEHVREVHALVRRFAGHKRACA